MSYKRNPEIVNHVQRLFADLHGAGFENFTIGARAVEDGNGLDMWDAVIVESEDLDSIEEYLNDHYRQSSIIKTDDCIMFQF